MTEKYVLAGGNNIANGLRALPNAKIPDDTAIGEHALPNADVATINALRPTTEDCAGARPMTVKQVLADPKVQEAAIALAEALGQNIVLATAGAAGLSPATAVLVADFARVALTAATAVRQIATGDLTEDQAKAAWVTLHQDMAAAWSAWDMIKEKDKKNA